MFENEEDNSTEMSEFENWYEANFRYFKRESNQQPGPDLDISLFFYGIYKPVMDKITPAVRKLMLLQYPVIDSEFRPMVLEYINWLVSSTGQRFMLNLYNLILDHKEGLSLREKYPEFKTWIDSYARPVKPDLITIDDYNEFSF